MKTSIAWARVAISDAQGTRSTSTVTHLRPLNKTHSTVPKVVDFCVPCSPLWHKSSIDETERNATVITSSLYQHQNDNDNNGEHNDNTSHNATTNSSSSSSSNSSNN